VLARPGFAGAAPALPALPGSGCPQLRPLLRQGQRRKVSHLHSNRQRLTWIEAKALTLEQALALLEAAKTHRLWAYVSVSLLGGLRTEEARALRWSEVDLEAGTVAVYRSVRFGGDTKTEKSRRVVQLPDIAVEALRELVLRQAADRAKAGTAWVENSLVFCRSAGNPLTDHDVWLQFRRITEKAGLGTDWSPRELRHTFVSLLSDSGVPIEQIADAVGHSSTSTTENVYRHQLRPVLRTAATALGPLFVGQPNGSSGEV